MKTHKELIVWQRSIDFVTDIYKLTKSFPKEEIYGITSQLRRSAVSVPANIAEGFGRKNSKELIQFLYISLGSATELETLITISFNLEYIQSGLKNQLMTSLEEIIRMLTGLIKSVSK